MSLLVVGSIALDTVRTPHGNVSDALGGSATYFSMSARLFSSVLVVGVVGEDFPTEHLELLKRHGIDIRGVEVVPGKTFRWAGAYDGDMSFARTMDTQLNVFAKFDPKLSPEASQAKYLFLANIHPSLQRKVLARVNSARLVFCDTMNLWIQTQLDEVKALLGQVTGVILNDQEARMLSKETNLIQAGQRILGMGPKIVVVKKGEHGALLFKNSDVCPLPAYPLATVVDPTGAGDSFAGGMMGHLARTGGDISLENLKRAVAFGIMTSSFCCEAFSLNQMKDLEHGHIEARLHEYQQLLAF